MAAWARATLTAKGEIVLRAPIGHGRVAFIESGQSGELWGRVYPEGRDAAQKAATEFATTAASAAVTVTSGFYGPVGVVGNGIMSRLVRMALAGYVGRGPRAVIDTSGSPANISAAIADMDPLGIVVLAAPPATEYVDLRVYTDLHTRGLTVAGVPWARGTPASDIVIDLASYALRALGQATPGQPPRSAWYCVRDP
jgi:hypothetical protein